LGEQILTIVSFRELRAAVFQIIHDEFVRMYVHRVV
jgi:hypothetical protein